MGKKKATSGGKGAAKAEKKAKADKKQDKKQKKKVVKNEGAESDSDDDLEAILEKMRKEWEEAHTVTEELVEGPPSRRASATITACPTGNYLWCIGGEFFSPDKKAYFYNDVFRYTPEKDEWRKYVSKTCPGPRSAHAVVASPAGGGKLFLLGGEFSSIRQTNFLHYRDFWCFDITTHSWDRIEVKPMPSSRSGHRMAIWKHYIVLFGGFYDPGITTKYLDDLWVFDIQAYQWKQMEFKPTDLKPSARSGFSFLSTADGIVLHGGYCKEYIKGKRPVGIMLEDTWFLRMSLSSPEATISTSKKATLSDHLSVKWERRKRQSKAYAPSIRSGCTMALWAAKDMGILFGGVTDEDKDEETLESVFHNDLNGLQLTEKGRWASMALKHPKKKGGGNKKRGKAAKASAAVTSAAKGDSSDYDDEQDADKDTVAEPDTEDIDPDDPILTIPLPRYNAMLAVLRNTLYIYGGIFESGSHEYTLDDFYYIPLDKLDRYVCLKPCDVVITEGSDSESSDDDDDNDDSSGSDESDSADDDTVVEEAPPLQQGKKDKRKPDVVAGNDEVNDVEETNVPVVEQDLPGDIHAQATQFMGVAKSSTRTEEDVLSTPLPGETLAMFYSRSREYWAQMAHSSNDSRGKQQRRDGFAMAQECYTSYKPILQEVEKIFQEAGLDREEIKNSAAFAGTGDKGVGTQSRNRR